jgi:hypothetical protein
MVEREEVGWLVGWLVGWEGRNGAKWWQFIHHKQSSLTSESEQTHSSKL